jgi:hypothetical protein
MAAHFKAGDCVIYRKQKFSSHPGPHARGISPAPNGDSYSYCVDKCYRVMSVRPDRTVVVCTRRGRQRTLAADDPALRRAKWWERLLLRRRFPPCPSAEWGHPPDGNAGAGVAHPPPGDGCVGNQ